MEKLIKGFVDEWKDAAASHEGFAGRVRAAIIAYRPEKEKKDLKDPKRLGQLALSLHKVRKACIAASPDSFHPRMDDCITELEAKYGADHADWKEWDSALTL